MLQPRSSRLLLVVANASELYGDRHPCAPAQGWCRVKVGVGLSGAGRQVSDARQCVFTRYEADPISWTVVDDALVRDRVPELLEDADVYMGIFLAEPRAHVFPTVYAGTLTCKEARIAELGSETPSGTVGDRYHTIVLDPFTMVSARMALHSHSIVTLSG